MANDLATTDLAPGQRDLAWLARNPSAWTIEAAMGLVGPDPAGDVGRAADRIRGELAPVPASGPLNADWRNAMDERLRRLAVKIAPGMSVEQGAEWRGVMVDALADLPALVSLTAAKRLIHIPLRFLNEIEAELRRIAAGLMAVRRGALQRLQDLLAHIAAANMPALPAPPPLTAEEVRRMSHELREVGLRCGALTQADIDAADAEELQQAA